MSVATAITDLSARIQGAFSACEAKGATMPQSRTTHTLSACIDSIQSGSGDLTWQDIKGYPDQRGIWKYPGDDGHTEPYDFYFTGIRTFATTGPSISNFFANNKRVRKIVFPDLTTTAIAAASIASQSTATDVIYTNLSSYSVGSQNPFNTNTKALSAIEYPALRSTTSNTRFGYSGYYGTAWTNVLKKINFDSLKTIGKASFTSAFANHMGLSTINFPELEEVGLSGAMYFNACNNSTISALPSNQAFLFPKLKTVSDSGMMFFSGPNGLVGSPPTQNISVDLRSLETIDTRGLYGFIIRRNVYESNQSIHMTKADGTWGDNYCYHFPSLKNLGNEGLYDFPYNLSAPFGTVFKFYFPQLSSISQSGFSYMGHTNSTYGTNEIHFGAANEATLTADPNYSTLWGAVTSITTVYFDL